MPSSRLPIAIVADFPLTRGKARILPLLDFLENLEPQGIDTDLTAVRCRQFFRRRQRTGLAVVVSDLFAPSGYRARASISFAIAAMSRMSFSSTIRQEARPDMLGDVELFDIENDASRKVTVTENALRMYRRLFDDYQRVGGHVLRELFAWAARRRRRKCQFDDLILRMMRVAGAVA